MINAPLPVNYGYAQPMMCTPMPQQPVMMQQPAMMPQQQPVEYSAIKINIIDPKVQTPGSQSVYGCPQAPIYSYPTAPQTVPVYYPPVQQQAQVIMQPPVQQPVPAPQVVNTQTNYPQPGSVIQEPAPVQQPAPTQVQQPTVVPQPEAKPQVATLDVPGFAAAIKSDDLVKAGDTIEKVADIAQTQPDQLDQLLDTDLMESLLFVIGKDVSGLEGPTEKQKELREQIVSGKTLSPEDLALANEVSPLEIAERNKQYALFTTAILQDATINAFKKTNNITPDIKDLPGMEQIVTTIKDNQNPMLRASALAALAYNARPEYKSVMKEIFELSKQDADENVQKVAEEGLAKLSKIADAA